MKCENCGREEVNFHFSANINGNITEKHLCTECAGKLGYTDRTTVRTEASFEDIFMELFGARPNRRAFGGYSMMLPTFFIPAVGVLVPNTGYGETEAEADEPSKPAEIKPEIDPEMQRRREVNMLREQMKLAAEAEDFEKAAACRDSIKKLENGENS